VSYMPKKNSEPKTALISTRVTSPIKRVVSEEAQKEGLDVSEWVRSLITSELRRRGSLPTGLRASGRRKEADE